MAASTSVGRQVHTIRRFVQDDALLPLVEPVLSGERLSQRLLDELHGRFEHGPLLRIAAASVDRLT